MSSFLIGSRNAHIHAIDHTSDIVSYKIPPLTPRRRSPKGGTAQTPRHKSEGPRAVVGHDTVCCTRDSEPAKTRVFVTPCNRDVEVKVVVELRITNYSRGYNTSDVNVETIRPRLSVLRQYLPVLQLGVPSGRSWLHEVGEVANGRRVG